jgi:hypothetical protein
MKQAGSIWGALSVMVIIAAIYFAPTITAWQKPQRGSVFAINFFLGWTLIGWVVALAWAAKNELPPQVIIHGAPPILCHTCGKYSQPNSKFCDSCGHCFGTAIAR